MNMLLRTLIDTIMSLIGLGWLMITYLAIAILACIAVHGMISLLTDGGSSDE